MRLWYDPDGRPIGVTAAGALLGDMTARRVASTNVATDHGFVSVSTVFLVLDHNHARTGPPILWETMIFGGPLDQEQWRYASRADALAGHDEAVTLVRMAIDYDGAGLDVPPRWGRSRAVIAFCALGGLASLALAAWFLLSGYQPLYLRWLLAALSLASAGLWASNVGARVRLYRTRRRLARLRAMPETRPDV